VTGGRPPPIDPAREAVPEFVDVPPLLNLSATEQWTLLLMEGVTCFWFFALGTAFGSFLNVVVYRMPRGLPVSGSSSHCPGCRRLIPWYDNVPVFGYLRLRGRCQCRAQTISARYPIVETLVGLLVLALLLVELLSGGVNLPLRQPSFYKGVVGVVWSLQWDLIGSYFYHITLLYVLLGMALIDLDGFGPPRAWLLFGLAVGLIAPLAAPFLQLVPLGTAAIPPASPSTIGRADALARSLAGLGAGALLGTLLALPWQGKTARPGSFAHLVVQVALAGAFLGWQAAASIALAAALVLLVLRRAIADEPALAGFPPSLLVWILVLVQVLAWGPLSLLSAWPGAYTSVSAWIAIAIVFSGLLLFTRGLPLPSMTPPPPPALDRPHVSVEAIAPLEITSDER
jgi:prepilin signal peptidase PulO-like enzyme (type II secretory pathway)